MVERVLPSPVMRFPEVRMEDVRLVVEAARSRSPRSVLMRLGDDQAVQNGLLRVLEDPGRCRMAIVSEVPLLPTVLSRVRLYRVGYLSGDEVVEAVLRYGVPEDQARWVASWAGGQVPSEQEVLAADRAFRAVRSVLQAISSKDVVLLERVEWDRTAWLWFRRWAVERVSGRWEAFDRDGAQVPEWVARAVLGLGPEAAPEVALRAVAYRAILEL
jgi:hypothetical protein